MNTNPKRIFLSTDNERIIGFPYILRRVAFVRSRTVASCRPCLSPTVLCSGTVLLAPDCQVHTEVDSLLRYALKHSNSF